MLKVILCLLLVLKVTATATFPVMLQNNEPFELEPKEDCFVRRLRENDYTDGISLVASSSINITMTSILGNTRFNTMITNVTSVNLYRGESWLWDEMAIYMYNEQNETATVVIRDADELTLTLITIICILILWL